MAKTKSKKSKEKEAKKKLQKDVEKLEHDWEELLSKKKETKDKEFLEEMAEDIKNLNEDTYMAEGYEPLEPTVHMIHHMLTTPWGAPFVFDKTLLEAAVSFEYQEASHSDLSHLMDEFTEYSSLAHNQFLTVLGSISDDLEE